MKLISGVNLLPLHKPMDIAEQYAAIDVMSGGRLMAGFMRAMAAASIIFAVASDSGRCRDTISASARSSSRRASR